MGLASLEGASFSLRFFSKTRRGYPFNPNRDIDIEYEN
jgi:hypothetical protein